MLTITLTDFGYKIVATDTVSEADAKSLFATVPSLVDGCYQPFAVLCDLRRLAGFEPGAERMIKLTYRFLAASGMARSRAVYSNRNWGMATSVPLARMARLAGGDAMNADTGEMLMGRRWLGDVDGLEADEHVEPDLDLVAMPLPRLTEVELDRATGRIAPRCMSDQSIAG